MSFVFRAMCEHPSSISNDGNNVETYTLCSTLSEMHRCTNTTVLGLEETRQKRPWNTNIGRLQDQYMRGMVIP